MEPSFLRVTTVRNGILATFRSLLQGWVNVYRKVPWVCGYLKQETDRQKPNHIDPNQSWSHPKYSETPGFVCISEDRSQKPSEIIKPRGTKKKGYYCCSLRDVVETPESASSSSDGCNTTGYLTSQYEASSQTIP